MSDDSEDSEEDEEWEVHRIVDIRNKKDRKREFLIRWKGYKSNYDSWESEENLNCPDLIDEYMAKTENAKNVVPKELRPVRKTTNRLVDRMPTEPKADNNRSSRRLGGKQS